MEQRSEFNLEQWVDDQITKLNPPGDWNPNLAQGEARFQNRHQVTRVRERRLLWAAGGVAVTGVCLLAFPVTRAFAQRCMDACVQQTSRVGQFIWYKVTDSGGLPRSSAGAQDRRIAPDFTLADASGTPVRLSEFRGKVVLLNFWATWCNPCGVEIPWFMEFQRVYRDRDLVVLGVALDEDGWKSVRPYVDEKKVNYRIMVGGEGISGLYGGVESLPTTLLIDRRGHVAATHVGLVSKETHESAIQALIDER